MLAQQRSRVADRAGVGAGLRDDARQRDRAERGVGDLHEHVAGGVVLVLEDVGHAVDGGLRHGHLVQPLLHLGACARNGPARIRCGHARRAGW